MRMQMARKTAGLEQSDMAAHFAVSRQTVSNWERGVTEATFSQVVQWAAITQQPLEWLAEGVNAKTAPTEVETVSGLVHPLGLEPRTH